MRTLLKPLSALLPWRGRDPHASELYGAIVAQARLPVFYQRLGVQQQLGVPDTLEGRFVVLSMHLFALLHRLKDEGEEAAKTAQALADLFAADMETVLREVGVGDLAIPKKVRGLIASGAGLLESYEAAYVEGGNALEQEIADALPHETCTPRAVAADLTAYLRGVLSALEGQSVRDLCRGLVTFPHIRDCE